MKGLDEIIEENKKTDVNKITILLKNVLSEMIENKEIEQKILKEIGNVIANRPIEVHDGNDNDWDRKYLHAVDSRIYAHLVIEEDGSINWYFQPNEHSDYVLFAIPVKKLGEQK